MGVEVEEEQIGLMPIKYGYFRAGLEALKP